MTDQHPPYPPSDGDPYQESPNGPADNPVDSTAGGYAGPPTTGPNPGSQWQQPGPSHPDQGYPASPGQVPPGYPPGAGPAYGAPPPPSHKNRKLAIVGAGVVVLALVGSVTAYAVSRDSSPASADTAAAIAGHLPADTLAMASVTLKPSGNESTDALEFLRRFPGVRDNGTGSSDLLQGLVGKNSEYNTQVKPWLGDQSGVGVDLRGGKPRPIAVIQTTDPAKAKAYFQSKSHGTQAVHIDGKYLLVSDTQADVDAVATDVQNGSLAKDSQFTSDMKTAPHDAIATGWVDVGRGIGLLEQSPVLRQVPARERAQLTKLGSARIIGSLRFDSSYADLALKLVGLPATDTAVTPVVGSKVGRLPSDTALAFGIGGLDKGITKGWSSLQQLSQIGGGSSFGSSGTSQMSAGLAQLDRAAAQIGLKLPQDLATLLGSQTVVAVGPKLQSEIGVMSVTDPRAAGVVAAKLQRAAQGHLATKATPDGIVLASSPEWAAQLQSGGSLGSSAAYKQAVSNPDKAAFIMYVNVNEISSSETAKLNSGGPAGSVPLIPLLTEKGAKSAGSNKISAIGMSVSRDSSTSATVDLRLVAH